MHALSVRPGGWMSESAWRLWAVRGGLQRPMRIVAAWRSTNRPAAQELHRVQRAGCASGSSVHWKCCLCPASPRAALDAGIRSESGGDSDNQTAACKHACISQGGTHLALSGKDWLSTAAVVTLAAQC